MSAPLPETARRVLIASANPLFAKGLQTLTAQRWAGLAVETRLARTTTEAAEILETWKPDLVIVDYDDAGGAGDSVERGAFLRHFINGSWPMQVMLVSLRESGEVVVYDRRTLTPAQAEDWLDAPWIQPRPESNAPAASAGKVNHAAVPIQAASTAKAADAVNPSDQPFRLRSGGMKINSWKHYVVPAILTIIFTFVMAYTLQHAGLLPRAASTQAGPVDAMIYLQLWIISFLFSLITVAITYSAIVFRHRPGDSGFGVYFKSSNKLEIFWTIVPLGTVIVLAFIGARDLAQIRRPDANALEVKVTAFQWGWAFEYPVQGIKTNQLYLPVNRQVHLSMTSRDVIHSFWVPEFRIKQDILPGDNLVKELRINPTTIGSYTVYCNQLCGGAHAYMTAPVKVVSTTDFDQWVSDQTNTASLTPAQRGERLAQVNGCVGCHSLTGAKLPGPTWKGLAGEQVKLADGTTITADDAYLHTSIVDPNAQITAGFPPGLMPATYKTALTDQQINDLIAYIKTIH